ncbi:MAG: hypothetical protein LH614_05040, partial [Pyrinomonadaceae bacterium]|nr:hypothetical protein [Pyrinomonadaceae bacterium]
DGGETWQKTNGITPKHIAEAVPISSITIDPKDSERIYVGTTQTLYLTTDGGKTWLRRGGNLPLGDFTSIIINPRNSKEVFAASALESDGGIFFSDDAGMKWKRIDTKDMKLPSRRVWSMIFDPNDSNRIFAGTHSSGVYRIERAVKPTTAEKTVSPDNVTRPRIATANEN